MISDSIFIRTTLNGTSQLNFNESGGNCHRRPRNSGNVKERRNKISSTQHKKFVSTCNIYRPKNDSGHRPVINLKKWNKHIPYINFKMKGLFLLKEILLKGDYLCKIDLKDKFLTVPLNLKSQTFVSFRWKDLIYQFLCLCFGLGLAPRMFTKLLKILISLMRNLNV